MRGWRGWGGEVGHAWQHWVVVAGAGAAAGWVPGSACQGVGGQGPFECSGELSGWARSIGEGRKPWTQLIYFFNCHIPGFLGISVPEDSGLAQFPR